LIDAQRQSNSTLQKNTCEPNDSSRSSLRYRPPLQTLIAAARSHPDCRATVGRKNWTFAGSDAGGHRAAAVYSLVQTCKLNNVDPQAWLADVLARLPDYPANKIADLLPWNWQAARLAVAA
jgi:hypothetical protein